MKVLKFGGSSVGSSERVKNIINILSSYHKEGRFAVVFSAFGGVTDSLIELSEKASRGENYFFEFEELKQRHFYVIDDLIPHEHKENIYKNVDALFRELGSILHGVSILREITPRIQDHIKSFGELLSCGIIAEAMNYNGLSCELLDSRGIISTDNHYSNARVDFKTTNQKIIEYFDKHPLTQIVTGFIASAPNGETTTLGRGGSDYTAAILGAALETEEIEIWTDVDGIMTADPRKVIDAFSLKAVTYQEAIELSHFGAKVIHPPTMHPALAKKIKIRIKNTFNPEFKGTVILEREESIPFSVKGISSIDSVALLRVEGSGMIGIEGAISRIFDALADDKIRVLLIAQGSSGYTICFAVLPEDGEKAVKTIEKEFKLEIFEGLISRIDLQKELSIIAVVGEDMIATPGIAGRVSSALGKNGVNVIASAQGSNERNISHVIKKAQLRKALNALHGALFLSRQRVVNLFLAGPGNVGKELLNMIEVKAGQIYRDNKIKVKLIGLISRQKMYINEYGIKPGEWGQTLEDKGVSASIKDFIETMKGLNLSNTVFADCTAGKDIVPLYPEVLGSYISIVTPNKIANSLDTEFYKALRETADRHNVQFRYSANVGAGLPVIDILDNYRKTHHNVVKIEAVLSGTLSYLFNEYRAGKKFSEAVKQAYELGITEPDPRDDLNGIDVARKLLILVREAGYIIEPGDIQIESLIPPDLADFETKEDFLNNLDKLDDYINSKKVNTNKILSYAAVYENGKAFVGIKEFDVAHPFSGLRGSENLITVYTEHYDDTPLIIKGTGAGAKVTAAAVYSDILRIANYLG